jgi:transcriptional regulator with XRE-family HTH domain
MFGSFVLWWSMGPPRQGIGKLANALSECQPMSEELSSRLGRNIRQLRQVRGLTQQQMAKLSGLPRATWSNLESGDGNPTLTVLHAVAMALQVSLEEIVAEPRSARSCLTRCRACRSSGCCYRWGRAWWVFRTQRARAST